MIGQLVQAVRPGVARVVAANPGDSGIDIFIGNLGGLVTVWQSKYFFPEVSKIHQSQIRESFKSAIENAAKEGFKLTQWVLCVPASMDSPTTKWWDGWKRRQERATGVVIELWDETELRRLLISPDAENVRRHYYEPAGQTMGPGTAVIDLAEEDADRLETALFVPSAAQGRPRGSRRLQRAVLQRRAHGPGDSRQGRPGRSRCAVFSGGGDSWALGGHFNDACQACEGPRLPKLHRSVMGDIRAQHAALAVGLPGGPVHTCGLMHRIVDNRRAGWVRHWRQVADDHAQVGDPQAPTRAAKSAQPAAGTP